MSTDIAAADRAVIQPDGSHLIKFAFDEHLPFAARGQGVFVYDTAGRRYLDGCSGAVNVNIGHADPAVLDRMQQQADQLTFAHRGAFHTGVAERLADQLCDMTGYPYVFFCNSGSEAVEAALRLVLQMWHERDEHQRSWFPSHAIGYHGSTLGGLSLSGHPLRRSVAEPLLHRFNVLTPPYAYRYAHGREDADFTDVLLAGVDAELDRAGPATAGVVIEPVGGAAGGAITPPSGYLAGLAERCRARGLPLITDEVMTGLGRTGRMLATDHYGVRPDVVALGKGLGGGYTPIAAVLVTAEIVETIATGSGAVTNGHTYGGNPLSCAVALAVLDTIMKRDLISAARHRGEQLRAGLAELAARHRLIGEVRGLGLLHGLELVQDRQTKASGKPIGSLTQRLVTTARDNGLLVYPATGGVNDAVLIAPPLTITADELTTLIELLDASLSAAERDLP